MRTILCASDLSEGSDEAVIQAASYCGQPRTRLVIVHVQGVAYSVPVNGYVAPLLSAQELEAIKENGRQSRPALREGVQKRLAGELRETGVQAAAVVEDGPAASGIVRLAESLPAELVVLGTAGKTGLRRVILGSVAEAVVRRAPCSVLVVRGGMNDVTTGAGPAGRRPDLHGSRPRRALTLVQAGVRW